MSFNSNHNSKIIKESARSLIYCSAGDRINNLKWMEGLTGFDVALAYYGDDPNLQADSKYFISNKDYKIPNFIQLARVYPEVLSYDYYYFIDDDMVFDANCLSIWKDIIVEYNLDVSQPSLSLSSKTTWRHVKKQKLLSIDYNQFVEVQCFCLSSKALRLALPFFFMAKTGTGLDVAIYKLCQRHNLKSAVIHDLEVYHPRRELNETVRKQFSDFKKFNQQLSGFISFCFDDKDIFSNLSQSARSFGNTSYRVIRFVATMRYILKRGLRKIKSMIT